jgi:SPP1 family predicted phage head-tail adaptor
LATDTKLTLSLEVVDMIYKGLQFKQTTTNDLTERISIVYFETSRNSKGDIVKGNEITRCTVWAKVLPLAGKINDDTPQRENEITYRITIRYRTDIKPDDEIVWRGRRLKITTPPFDVENRHIWTQFECIEVVQDGKSQ